MRLIETNVRHLSLSHSFPFDFRVRATVLLLHLIMRYIKQKPELTREIPRLTLVEISFTDYSCTDCKEAFEPAALFRRLKLPVCDYVWRSQSSISPCFTV